MKIEVLEEIRHGRDVFHEGESRVVDDDVGAYFCANGWAKDAAGAVETANRDPRAVTVVPDSVSNKLTSTEV